MSVFLKRGSNSFYPPPRIVCFVCAAEVPSDYPIYVEPQHGALASPHFPFLLAHSPPLGCHPVEGEAKSCRPCYTTLMRQWDEYERARMPLVKRAYWIKRADGVPFLTPEQQQAAALQVQSRLHQRGPPVLSRSTPQGLMIAPLPPVVTAEDKVNSTLAPVAHGLWSTRVDARIPPIRPIAQAAAPPGSEDTVLNSGITGGGNGNNSGGDNDSALDLSSGSRERETMKSRSSAASHISAVSHHSSYQSEGAGSSTDILDLTLPDKNAAFEVCYVCGDEFKRGVLSFTFAKQMNKEPFYPSLMCHSRPPRSRPMDSSGRVQTCDDCHNHLLQQWFQFEGDDLPHADRNYALRKRQAPLIDNTTFVCYICALDYHSSSLRLLYARPNSEQEPYYPFIEQQKPPPGASPISPQGMVQVCTLCYKSTKEKHHGFLKADQPPPKKRRFETSEFNQQVTTNSPDDEDKSLMPADVTCILCRRKFSVGSFKFLHSQGPPVGGLPYFPFLTDLTRPEEFLDSEEDKQARIRACQACTTSLMNQWTAFQREGVAVEVRKYTYPSLVTGPRSVSSARAQSPASQLSGGTVTPGGKIEAVVPNVPRARSNTLESRPHSASNPHSPNPPPPIASPAASSASAAASSVNPRATPVPPTTTAAPSSSSSLFLTSSGVIPPPACHSPSFSVHSAASAAPGESGLAPNASSKTTTSSFYCFLCGLHSELSFSRMLYSTPQGKKAPYFPFMKKHVPKNKAETLREDGTALVCTFCYHSIMVQWSKYNDSKPLADPSQRKYNINDYHCYVCGIMTYRKRIRALRVLDYPFLRHHKPRKGVIMLENSEMVAVCLDCYERLRGQYSDGERYGIPVEQRQYNWMKIPPPPEDSATAAAAAATPPPHQLIKPEHAAPIS